MILVSVIIPVYNSSKYLVECLDSVTSQTLQEIEIICINDGSTDNSLEIIKEFHKKDSRIKFIHQKNQGVSAARNAGLDLATGKYIGFVDADDSIDDSFYENLYNISNKEECSVVYSNTLSERVDLEKNMLYEKQILRESLLPLFFRKDIYNSTCNKLYLHSVLKNNNIRFQVGKKHGEDAEFNVNFLMYADSLFMYDYSGYNYHEVQGSATRNLDKFNYFGNALAIYKKDWSSLIGNMISDDQMEHLKKERFINAVISLIYIYSDPQRKLDIFKRLRKLSEIVNNRDVRIVFNRENFKWVSLPSKYTRAIYNGIKNKQVLKLYLLSIYSYYKNK